MNLYFRLIYTLLVSFFQARARVDEEQILHFRTWPHDLDLNLHINNGRYLTLMDLGRMQLLVRLGLLGPVVKNLWMPVIGAAHIRFRKSLSPFQSFELRTRIVSWDEKWIYIEQNFVSKGERIASAHIKGLIKGRKSNVSTKHLLEKIGHFTPPSHPIPKFFAE
jgi:acyl-CoA thioesterase FadM